ncbi:MAG TPA: hypothetical protein VJ044_11060 [Candidatus Hodarchaeales archaeon]|nr:hypothetical protein [Candidatus Hodarchaeales archaeon]
MSADNWARCPECRKRNAEQSKSLYGAVSEEEYRKWVDESEKEDLFTLREDYEIWIDGDVEFHVTYRGHCEMCGFIFTFNHTEKALKD